jgi:hypothetical protein
MGAFPSATDGPASFFFFPIMLLLLLPTNLSKNIFSAHFFLCRAIILFRVFNGECLNVPFSQNNGL